MDLAFICAAISATEVFLKSNRVLLRPLCDCSPLLQYHQKLGLRIPVLAIACSECWNANNATCDKDYSTFSSVIVLLTENSSSSLISHAFGDKSRNDIDKSIKVCNKYIL